MKNECIYREKISQTSFCTHRYNKEFAYLTDKKRRKYRAYPKARCSYNAKDCPYLERLKTKNERFK
jgi:hypothetical protein